MRAMEWYTAGMRNWLKRRGEALLDNIIAILVAGFVAGLIIAGVVAVALAAWTLLTSPTGPAAVTIGIGGFAATIFALRQVSALIEEHRDRKSAARQKASKYITPNVDNDFVLSSDVAWYWNGANMDGPLCPLRGHIIALDYEPREEVGPGRLRPPIVFGQTAEPVAGRLKPPIPPFSLEDAVRGLEQEQEERRAPLEDDRVGLGAGKLVCPKGEEKYMLDSFDLSGRGKMIGEARDLAFKEYQAKIRQRQLAGPSVHDTEDSPPQ